MKLSWNSNEIDLNMIKSYFLCQCIYYIVTFSFSNKEYGNTLCSESPFRPKKKKKKMLGPPVDAKRGWRTKAMGPGLLPGLTSSLITLFAASNQHYFSLTPNQQQPAVFFSHNKSIPATAQRTECICSVKSLRRRARTAPELKWAARVVVFK